MVVDTSAVLAILLNELWKTDLQRVILGQE